MRKKNQNSTRCVFLSEEGFIYLIHRLMIRFVCREKVVRLLTFIRRHVSCQLNQQNGC